MKSKVKYLLHRIFGFKNYLFLFSLFKIYTLRWDKKEGDFLYFLELIPPGGTVLDIGANIGIMTKYLAQRIKNTSVFAFEPIPDNIHTLKRIKKFFGIINVTVMEYALGEENGKVDMVMPIMSSVKMQGLSHVLHDTIYENNEGQMFSVPLFKLDDVEEIQKSSKPVTGIKIDVENFEYFVLKGGMQILKKYKPVVYCELWDNENRKKCFRLLEDLGYVVKVLDKSALVRYDKMKHKTQNFFFIPLS